MLIKCQYCECYFDDGDKVCPTCGAANPNYILTPEAQASLSLDPEGDQVLEKAQQLLQDAESQLSAAQQAPAAQSPVPGAPADPTVQQQPQQQPKTPGQPVTQPRTIAELAQFAAAHNLPLEQMRVHIGEDYRGPKAYGIFRDANGSFVVYKNKADGSRSIRYSGPDEAHAVGELFAKMREQMQAQKAGRAGQAPPRQQSRAPGRTAPSPVFVQNRGSSRRSSSSIGKLLPIFIIIAVLIANLAMRNIVSNRSSSSFTRRGTPNVGYYHYDDRYYYHDPDDWYYYDPLQDLWVYTILSESDPLYTDYDEYWQGSRYYDTDAYTDFYDPAYGYDANYDYYADPDYGYSEYSSYDYDYDDDDDWFWDWDDDDDDWDWDDDWDYDDDWDDWDNDW